MTDEHIMEKYPSICYHCKYCRDLPSEENLQNGYTGCNLLVRTDYMDRPIVDSPDDLVSNINAETVATGWVRTSNRIFTRSKRAMVNHQLVTRCTRKCNFYEPASFNKV